MELLAHPLNNSSSKHFAVTLFIAVDFLNVDSSAYEVSKLCQINCTLVIGKHMRLGLWPLVVAVLALLSSVARAEDDPAQLQAMCEKFKQENPDIYVVCNAYADWNKPESCGLTKAEVEATAKETGMSEEEAFIALCEEKDGL